MATLVERLIPVMGWLFLLALLTVNAFLAIQIYKHKVYKKTEYFEITKKPYNELLRDIGAIGEYYTFKHLTKLPGDKRFLFNCYVPKEGGGTSEVDVIMLHTSGIYVFESKNYSGWIYGTETQQKWTQTFHNRHKEHFFNPIMQNNTHIYWLKRFLPDVPEGAFRSIIVFSDRCTLKKIKFDAARYSVINRREVYAVVSKTAANIVFTGSEIANIYQRLFPFTQVSNEVKATHIEAIQQRNRVPVAVTAAAAVSNAKPAIPTRSEPAIGNPICAKCGAEMQLKTASRGKNKGKSFWGCPNYPRCRNIISEGV